MIRTGLSVLVIAGAIMLLPVTESKVTFEDMQLRTPDGVLRNVLHADTLEERILGLSERTEMEPYDGMLFTFEEPGSHTMWMADMHFAIDIIWIDTSDTIVHIEQSVAPDTYPEEFGSPVPAIRVLELPAGTAPFDWIGKQVHTVAK